MRFGKKKEELKLGYASEMLYQLREWYTAIGHLLWEDRFLGGESEIKQEKKSLKNIQTLVRMDVQSILRKII